MSRRGITSALLAIALLAVGVWGAYQYQLKNDYKIALSNDYQRLFHDTKAHIANVQVALSKALLSDSKEQNVLLLTQIMQQASLAQDKLSQLPVSHSDISKTQKYLTQVADYSYSLVKQHLTGKELDSKQRESMFNLQDYSAYLTKELATLQDKIMKGDVALGRVERKQREGLRETNEDMLNTSLAKFEETMTEYPELIYDGPFSDQIMNMKPKGLGNKKVSVEEARKIAEDFLGNKQKWTLTLFEEGDQLNDAATIPSHSFSVSTGDRDNKTGGYISVSKQGGHVVWMANPRGAGNISLSMKQAQDRALKFLEEKGYKNMEPNYSLRYDGVGLFNFAYTEKNVTIYPDLIKVKVALDNGDIVGFEAAAYLHAHHNRQIPEPKLTQEEARDKVRLDFNIDSIRLAMIPKGSKEVLCYEFKGKYKESDYIVYINALDGKEEQILQIIKDENGTLTF
ncbi:germination protein YpeB [Proteiniborus sp.]|uniref:germination protein YpeB n=1 Tax=Proteiniborus sp. TaxID=2079015 RepID=UPI00332E1590